MNYYYLQEVAECILLHLTHHFDNFAPFYGPATINRFVNLDYSIIRKNYEINSCYNTLNKFFHVAL